MQTLDFNKQCEASQDVAKWEVRLLEHPKRMIQLTATFAPDPETPAEQQTIRAPGTLTMQMAPEVASKLADEIGRQ